MATRPKPYAKARCRRIDISRLLNFPGLGPLRGTFWKELARQVHEFPTGPQKPWGIPFSMANERAPSRVILVRNRDEVRIPVGAKADYVCLLHTFREADTDRSTYMEAAAVGEYELRYADGSSHVQPVRARLDVPIPESPGPAQMAVPFTMPSTIDPVAAPMGEQWGRTQTGTTHKRGEPLVYALKNPHPGKPIREFVIRGLVKSPLLVAGITAYRGTAHPLRHLARRRYRVSTPGRKPAEVKDIKVDLGDVARIDRTLGPRNKQWLHSPYTGVTDADEPEKNGEDIFSIYGARDATVAVSLANLKRPTEFNLGETYETGSSASGAARLERCGGRKQWMQVRIIDSSTGKPTPVRLHISGPAGEYIAPYGHHEQVNANWFEDYGADLRVGGRNYAYVPGEFTTDLPCGDLYIEMSKGFEYAPKRCKVAVRPGQKELTLRIDRWKDLRSDGWVTADTHVHFLTPQTAWLEARAEGVNIVNLLASQWGRLFTNVGDISGRLGKVEDDTMVWVGTENRNHMLGHISMLGTKGLPVFPMCCGGVSEAWVGDPDFRTLTEWAQECKAKDGVVIRPHFPYCGFTEDPTLVVNGVVDALEIRQNRDGGFPLQEWYGYLNNGYRVAVAGGTDKMGAYCALGNLRTYAKLDTNRRFTYENWAKAIRAGRTISTNGPLMNMCVEGKQIGDTIRLPAGGGRLQVDAVAESAWNVGRIEIVRNGKVVASESSRKGARKLRVSAKVPLTGSGWVAARCDGVGRTPSAYMAAHTSPVYVTCGRQRPFDGPALEHMLNLTRGGIEYLDTIATRFSDKDQQRMIRIYRSVEQHLHYRLHNHT